MADSVRTEVLNILIRAENMASKQLAAVAGTEAAGGRISRAFAGIKLGLGVVGLAGVGFLGESVKAAADFNAMLVKTLNNTTMTSAQMQQVGKAILSMSAATGAPLRDLATGMMHISDVGFSVTDSITIMQQALESAMSTGANVGDVAQVLSSTMHEFGLRTADAAQTMDVLHLASAEGNSTLEQFVESSGKAFAMAANLHVPLTDVAASLAALSRHGIGAAQASTLIAGALSKIINPAVSTTTLLKKISAETGINLSYDFTTAGLAAKGLQGVMIDLGKASAISSVDVMKLIPATRGGLAALILTGRGAADYTSILGQLNEAMAGKLTPTAVAFMLQQKTTASAVDRLTASLHVMMIEIGQQLLPALNALLGGIAPIVTALGVWVTTHAKLATEILVVVSALGLLSGGMAVLELVLGPLAGMITALGAPLIAVAAVVGLVYEAWTHDWGGIREITESVWNAVHPIFDALGMAVDRLHAAFNKGGFGALFADLPSALGPVGTALQTLKSQIGAGLAGVNWGQIAATLTSGIGTVLSALGAWTTGTALPYLRAHLAGWATAYWDWIKGVSGPLLSALGGLLGQLGDWLGTTGLPYLRSHIGPWATAFWGWVQATATPLLSALGDLLGRLGDWITGTALPYVRSQVGPWADAFVAWVQQVWPPLSAAAGALLTRFGGWIAGAVAPIGTQLGKWAAQFGAWIPGAVTQFLKNWPQILSNLLDQVAKAAIALGTALLPWAERFVSWIAPMIPGMIKAAAGIATALFLFVVETVVTLQLKLAQWALAFVAWVVPMIPKMIAALVQLGQQFDAWITGMLPTVEKDLGQWATAFVAWIAPMATAAVAALNSFAGRFAAWLGTEATSLMAWGVTLGVDLVQGLINGLGSMLGSLQSAAGNIAENGIKGVWNNTLGRLSPSRWAHDFGIDVVQGAINGLTSMNGALGSASLATASTITTGFSAALQKAMATTNAGMASAGNARSLNTGALSERTKALKDLAEAAHWEQMAGIAHSPARARSDLKREDAYRGKADIALQAAGVLAGYAIRADAQTGLDASSAQSVLAWATSMTSTLTSSVAQQAVTAARDKALGIVQSVAASHFLPGGTGPAVVGAPTTSAASLGQTATGTQAATNAVNQTTASAANTATEHWVKGYTVAAHRIKAHMERAYTTRAGVYHAAHLIAAHVEQAHTVAGHWARNPGSAHAGTSAATPAAGMAGSATGAGATTYNITVNVEKGAIDITGSGGGYSESQARGMGEAVAAAIKVIVGSQMRSAPGARAGLPGAA